MTASFVPFCYPDPFFRVFVLCACFLRFFYVCFFVVFFFQYEVVRFFIVFSSGPATYRLFLLCCFLFFSFRVFSRLNARFLRSLCGDGQRENEIF